MHHIVETKAIYDIYGEYGLKEGCVNEQGGKYAWKTEALKVNCDYYDRENRRRLLFENQPGELLRGQTAEH